MIIAMSGYSQNLTIVEIDVMLKTVCLHILSTIVLTKHYRA